MVIRLKSKVGKKFVISVSIRRKLSIPGQVSSATERKRRRKIANWSKEKGFVSRKMFPKLTNTVVCCATFTLERLLLTKRWFAEVTLFPHPTLPTQSIKMFLTRQKNLLR